MKNIKSYVTLALAIAAPFLAWAADPGVIYISPNNDGIQDELTVPLKITDRRFISEWALVIEDQNGIPRRTIGNKEKRPEKITAKNIFQALRTPKQGVSVPQSVIWNGILDSGETAPDGVYTYRITAVDDNGNTSVSRSYTVVVDNTPPEINLPQPGERDKFFGEGDKALFTITQSGSVEDWWAGSITDTSGRKVRSFLWTDSAPETLRWDGLTDGGVPAPDGVYSYQITSTDRAGNTSAPASITNIVYSADRPSTAIALRGSRYFSPNGDGAQDTVTFDVTVPAPETGNVLTRWRISVRDSSGAERRAFGNSPRPEKTLVFDGRDSSGAVLGEGQYQAVLTASYLNGYEAPEVRSPVFVLDVTPPRLTLRAEGDVFSPDGDGNLDTIGITQSSSKEADWKGEILGEDGMAVRTFSLGGVLGNIAWNGQNDRGELCEDGLYTYRLSAVDQAGNSARSETAPFRLDTSRTEALLSVRPGAFSPNGDGVQDTVTFTPKVKTRSAVARYSLSVKNAGGAVVRTMAADRPLPATLSWDGRDDRGALCPDGFYSAQVDLRAQNGSETSAVTPAFEVDTVKPQASVAAAYTLFSPDGDGRKDTLPLGITASREDRWTGVITGAGGRPVRTYLWENAGAQSFAWDGLDEAGNVVPDGPYTFTLGAVDRAGNRTQVTLGGIRSDTRPARALVTTGAEAFTPYGEGDLAFQKFALMVSLNEGIESWTFRVLPETGEALRVWQGGEGSKIPETIRWDGRNGTGGITEGALRGALDITYLKGNTVHTEGAAFILSATPPRLTVRTEPVYFSPDNDGNDDDLFISLGAEDRVGFSSWSFVIRDPNNGREFWKTEGKAAITERIVWDGRGSTGELVQSAMDYPFTFTVTNILGMTSAESGLIPVDVLVVRVGDALKMQVPAIIFRSDHADFAGRDVDSERGLEQSVIDKNIAVLKRIAEILNKFRDYSVRIEGHANNVSGTEAEETSDRVNGSRNIPLVSLSRARAETVRKMLVDYGVDSKRLSTAGKGGREPVVPHSDRDNWWKNRRVEFILLK